MEAYGLFMMDSWNQVQSEATHQQRRHIHEITLLQWMDYLQQLQ